MSELMLIAVLRGLFLSLGAALASQVSYLLLLTGAAWAAPRRRPPDVKDFRRFLFLIPAHNEARLLPSLLRNLAALDYPSECYQVYVVADNCSDNTAELARGHGALVYERFNRELVGKGYALRWLLDQIWAEEQPHDAIVIIDADTIVSPNFLQVMNGRLAAGEVAIQAYYAVRDPDGSWGASLREIALAAVHYLRPLGRTVLGGSVGLKGNGMVFAADIARRYPWPASLTEDIEYHMALIMGGERVAFAPDAVVWAEMPTSLAAAESQNSRWERGRLEMVRRYVPQLLREARQRRSFLLFDAAVEQIIPPLSVVAAANLVYLTIAALVRQRLALVLGLWAVGGQIVYILSGLLLARVPRRVYQALLYVPIFLAWKCWLYLRIFAGRERRDWIRTARNTTE